MKIITDNRCVEYSCPGHPERPERIAATTPLFRAQKLLPMEWVDPVDVDSSVILRAHREGHLDRLSEGYDFDMDTPSYPDIDDHARRGVGGAIQAMRLARRGEQAFSLLRPPGHHATRDRAMGFCYLSNMAIAVLEARAHGVEKIAVFDFDVHHGNGTEEILLGESGVSLYSIHQVPAYPGTGAESRRNSHNYPVPPGLPRENYRRVAERALSDLEEFQPDLIGVSAGFDAYLGDPLCQQKLDFVDYHWFGERFRALGIPVFNVLEGGYSDDLPALIFAYLLGLARQPFGRLKEFRDMQRRLQQGVAEPLDPGHEPHWGPSF